MMKSITIAVAAFLSLTMGGSAWAETGPYFNFVPTGYHVRPDGSANAAGPVYDARGFYAGYYRPVLEQPITAQYSASGPSDLQVSPSFFDSSSDTSGINWDWTLGGTPPGGYSGF